MHLLMAIDLADLGKSFVRTFWNRDGASFFPDPDMARNALLTTITFGFGWILSLRGSSRRLKQRIVDELLMTQRELARRAYPDEYGGEWRQADPREVWMLAPLVSRIQFLVATLNDERSVSKDARTLMDVYVESVTDFIAEWSITKTRFIGADFETKFLRTYDVLVAVARAIGPLESSKTRGLLPKRFQMRTRFGLASILTAPNAPTTNPVKDAADETLRVKSLEPADKEKV